MRDSEFCALKKQRVAQGSFENVLGRRNQLAIVTEGNGSIN